MEALGTLFVLTDFAALVTFGTGTVLHGTHVAAICPKMSYCKSW